MISKTAFIIPDNSILTVTKATENGLRRGRSWLKSSLIFFVGRITCTIGVLFLIIFLFIGSPTKLYEIKQRLS